jgi:hypothetical protein
VLMASPDPPMPTKRRVGAFEMFLSMPLGSGTFVDKLTVLRRHRQGRKDHSHR